MAALTFLTFFILYPQFIHTERTGNFVIWNVGQGSWATWIQNNQCIHFDMGGEKAPWVQILKACSRKKNQIYLSHFDWDHTNFILSFTKQTKHSCWHQENRPTPKWLKKISRCQKKSPQVELLWRGVKGRGRNHGSHFHLVARQILITGDAPSSEENKAIHRIPRHIPYLLLGHHGSKTSSSRRLLQRLKPKFAIASARKQKFGHPHPSITLRLNKMGIPILTTEEFGNIRLQIKTIK